VTKNNVAPNGIDAATVLATVTDVNGNPVQGVTVEGEVVSGSPGDTAKITPKGTPITDDKGQSVFEVKDTVVETVSVKVKAQIGTRNIESEAVDVAFRPVVILECQEGMTIADACIKTLSSGDGTLFTNNPSTNFLRAHMPDLYYGESIYSDNPYYGQVGHYVVFNHLQAELFCDGLNDLNHLGRTNWEWAVAYKDDDDVTLSINSLSGKYPNRDSMVGAGWNTHLPYSTMVHADRGSPTHSWFGVTIAAWDIADDELGWAFWHNVSLPDHDWNGRGHPATSCRSETL
ncbi:Ig-like domain-containing protein, partial [Photobacterium leiognathi]